ncbi:MAG: hypothetical protein RB296_09935 [Acidobacteriota bacterium]|nr:hypothetical protein [Acidobacteriota bacterium]
MKRVVMLIVLLVLLGMFATLAGADEVTIIKDPQPTCVEKEYRQLVKVKELREDEDAEEFLVKPCSLVVDERGHIFAWDAAQAKIFQYDPELNLVRTFCRRGQGPGEISGNGPVYINLFMRGKEIYFPDSYKGKVICFNTDGELVREIPFKPKGLQNASVALDQSGNIYLHSDNYPGNRYCIDCLDPRGNFVRGFLSRSHLHVGLFVEFKMKPLKYPTGMPNSWYAYVNDWFPLIAVNRSGHLLAYSSASGMLWVFHKGKLTRTLKLWPEKALRDYKKTAFEDSGKGGVFSTFFGDLILDGDYADRFFLNYGNFRNGKKNHLYQFDLSGRLIRVYSISNHSRSVVQVKCKRHKKFYALNWNDFNNLTIQVFGE